MFYVYRLTSPSGRSYIGFTGQAVAERWRQHVNVAAKGKKHPLCCAIRKHGADSFTVETVGAYADRDSALRAEVEHIAAAKNPYNVSRGGEYDFIDGHAKMAELFNYLDWFSAYREALSHGCRSSKAHKRHWPELAKAGIKWRKDNPKEAWKNVYRASRVSRRTPRGRRTHKGAPTETMSAALKAFWDSAPASVRMRRRMTAKKAAFAQWARRTDAEAKAISEKISATLKSRNAALSVSEKEERDSQLSRARAHIDKSVQGPAASKGLKRFWADLKKDPEAYAAYMAKRSATLKARAGK